MKSWVTLLIVLFSVSACAQNAAKPTPAAAAQNPSEPPTYTAGKVCDVTYAAEVETSDNYDVSTSQVSLKQVPWADVADNHAKQLKVLDALSKAQDKGGEYQMTVSETNTCDDGVTVRVKDGSAFVTGVTLAGSVAVMDVALTAAKEINDRYRSRAQAGAKVGWNHSKAKKVRRDDLGRRIKVGD